MGEDAFMERARRIRLVITDMDGTLLNSKKQISRRNLEAVKRLREREIAFTICTGRIPTMAEYYISHLGIDVPVVTANGAVVWDPVRRSCLFERQIEPDTVQQILTFGMERGLDCCALTLGASYFLRNSRRIERFRQYNRIAGENGGTKMELRYIDGDIRFLQQERVYKMLIYEVEKGEMELAGTYLDTVETIAYTSSDPGLLDISAAGIDKGFGLKQAALAMGVRPEEICAFGDYYNDISLFHEAGFPIAMGNGCEAIKKLALYQTAPNDEDGVAAALERFLL